MTDRVKEFHAKREIEQQQDAAGNGIDQTLQDILFERSLERDLQSIRVEDIHSGPKAKARAKALRNIEIRREIAELKEDINFL